MKATRKLIPAFAMLLIAAVMMSTATFAWFSTNSQVNVNGITISAKANNTYLIISETASDMSLAGYTNTQVKYTTNNTFELFPVTYFKTAPSGKTTTEGEAVDIGWYIARAAEIDASAAEEGTYTPIAEGALEGGSYAVKKTYYIGIAENFLGATDLKVTGFTSTASAGTIVVKCGTNVSVCKSGNVDGVTLANALSAKKGETAAVYATVEVWYFIDGEDQFVYTNNATNLKNFTFDITFGVTAATT